MAKVIKLKDRQGSLVLPLTRSQLVQVSEITGLNLATSTEWSKASVQDALEALYTYASTNNAGYDKDIQDIKNALKGVLDATGAVVNYVDAQDTAYLALSYAEAAAKATEAQANSYAEAALKATAAETAAKNYADGKFLVNVKLNDQFVTVESDETNGRYVDLGSIATSDSLQTLTNKVNAIETAYITKTASEEADTAIVTAYEAADTAIVTGYQAADTAIVTGYTAADSTIISSYTAADEALSDRIDDLEDASAITVTEVTTGLGDNVLKAYKIYQGDATSESNLKGTINIPKDLVVTAGSVFTKADNDGEDSSLTVGAKYLKLTIANQTDPVYIPVTDLVDVYSTEANATEIQLTIDGNNEISADVVAIDSSKITFTPAGENPTNTTVQAALRDLYSQIGEGGSVASQIQTEIEKLDASYTASGTAAKNGTFVMNAVTQTDGKITSIGSVEVEAAGAAAAVKDELSGDARTYTNLGLVEDEIGAIRTAIDGLDTAAVKKVNNQTPNANGEVTVNASQIDTSYTYKIGNDASPTTHTVDEVLAAGVYFEEVSGASGNATADTTLFT